ncbi:hypothetical protein [Parvularcula maris]|uniref:Uncharacterized protein n=1 Tax=Parvularcula maris TaxID=2965077 RepID=A0A9X2RJP0_9PROT|nr:hypothetical protein [Parvularcula maris]MCQ8186076.1 hypothetical protein [Parvularcula maris]
MAAEVLEPDGMNIWSFRDARLLQRGIAAVFLLLGGWCILFPNAVAGLCLTPVYREGAGVPFLLACFGLQAVMFGTLLLLTRLDRRGFFVLALLFSPFLLFDIWFVLVQPVLTPLGGLLDGIGNTVMIALCLTAAANMQGRSAYQPHSSKDLPS